jgi:adenylosuccinate lyase
MNVISPIDGRYKNKTKEINFIFSEDALLKKKIQIEIDYLIEFCKQIKDPLPESDVSFLEKIYDNLFDKDIEDIAEIELKTKHDIKAIELWLREKINSPRHKEYVHFGLTSQDINSLALAKTINLQLNYYIKDEIHEVIECLEKFSYRTESITIPARTHGQVAVPTSLGKEIYVYVYRLKQLLDKVEGNVTAKFGGAVGNLNAHYLAYPDVQWNEFCNKFCERHLATRSQHTTQVDNNDELAAYFDLNKRINNVLIDFCRDMWMYFSYGYFTKEKTEEEVGSSTMPQKVNPIEFENAEGNLGFANAIFEFMSSNIQKSRLQRDLTDSTILRNIGVPYAHTVIAYNNIIETVPKLKVNIETVLKELDQHPEMLAEAIQILLRKDKIVNAYDVVKKYVNNVGLNKENLRTFVEDLPVKQETKDRLLKLDIKNYLGRFIRA